jgi:hypothetical protein
VPGTGVDTGTWTAFSYSAGWSESAVARYRLETITGGATTIQRIFCKGAILKALASSAILALIFPAGARPAQTRQFTLGGAQTEDGGDMCLYHGTVYANGNFEIRPVIKFPFTWPILTDTHTVYLDGMMFDL